MNANKQTRPVKAGISDDKWVLVEETQVESRT